MNEAPISDNFYYIDKDGYNHQLTLRGEDDMELFKRIAVVKKFLAEHGCVPKSVGYQNNKPGIPELPTALLPFEEAAVEFGGRIVEVPEQLPDETIQAETLVATVNAGKTYWKVKGGKYAKFGVTIWDEVLKQAGFDPAKLDPMKEYGLVGYTAVIRMKDTGKPEKVIRLHK